ncbi:MAG: tetraacyldisaccharide 4'-kinase [Chromatiales bacterium]|nr:tetraacyldisaccharide 4'-kinase [Chromatiales bacterium]
MKKLDAIWAGLTPVTLLLLPLSFLFCAIAWLRRRFYRFGLLKQHKLSVPVIVVGNISVGGTGKTPLVIWLVEKLQQLGFQPGIVSRGYGGKAEHWPQPVTLESDPANIGDEPALLAHRTGVPLWVGPDRVAAAKALLATHDCDLIVTDDGLQHYALGRDMEIVVVDAERRFGNGFCLPAGPLRERPSRLREVDLVVSNGRVESDSDWCQMSIQPSMLVNLADIGQRCEAGRFAGQTVHAFAGIGYPKRFFDTLRDLGMDVIEHPFPDHHHYSAEDFSRLDDEIVLMTEKDAVKCASFAQANHWYLTIDVVLDTQCQDNLEQQLRGINNG